MFITPMNSNLNDFIAAEILKQKLPVRIVLDEKDAAEHVKHFETTRSRIY